MTGCFIGIDQGSSSTKALALAADGSILFRTHRVLSPPKRNGDRIEQDPREIEASVNEVLHEAVTSALSDGHAPLGIGLSCQRSSCLLWDVRSGEPRSPVLSWRDTRGAALATALSGENAILFEATGLPLTPYYSATKLRWLRDNAPPAAKNTTVFGTLSSYLTQRLTAGDRALIDHTQAARMLLMNLRSLQWDPALLSLFGLTGVLLPDIVPTCHAFGDVMLLSDPVPLLASIGDQQAALIGLGLLEQGDAGLNYGTGGFLMINAGNDPVRVPRLMTSLLYTSDTSRCYLVEGSVNAVGDALEWLRLRLGLFSGYPDVDDLCWKASDDTVAFIGLNGTGAPHWESAISSSLSGLAADSGPADIVRAVVEGIAFFMKDIAEAARSSGLDPSRYVASGGLSGLTYLIQAQADILGRDMIVCTAQDASAMGAALLAGMQHGTWTPAGVIGMAVKGETFQPRKNPGLEKRYIRWKELHRLTKALDAR